MYQITGEIFNVYLCTFKQKYGVRYAENLKAKLMWIVVLVGYGYVVCGDEQGRLWMYHITDTMMEKFKSGKTISATEVS